ncbi:MAG: metal ABC transporter permease [Phycisphaeraceae bacterium]
MSDLIQTLQLSDYNTKLVVLSTAILGAAAGLVGTFLLLRKRSLMGDAISHATLPGVALAFIIAVSLGYAGKSLPVLLVGATVTGLLAAGGVMAIRRLSRLADDAAMGIVLSVFFGLGTALLVPAQKLPAASAAGLDSFIYGKTASMIFDDFVLISVVSAAAAALTLALRRELGMVCFDPGYAASQGKPVAALDATILGLTTAITVVGLQAVGLILIIAMLIIPPAAARFWTHDLKKTLLLAAAFGASGGYVGASLSATLRGLPAGAIIVLVTSGFFVISLLFGVERGVVIEAGRHLLNRRRLAVHSPRVSGGGVA